MKRLITLLAAVAVGIGISGMASLQRVPGRWLQVFRGHVCPGLEAKQAELKVKGKDRFKVKEKDRYKAKGKNKKPQTLIGRPGHLPSAT